MNYFGHFNRPMFYSFYVYAEVESLASGQRNNKGYGDTVLSMICTFLNKILYKYEDFAWK